MANKENGLIVDEMSDKIINTAERIVMSCGANNLTVRKVLQELNITNRVFYNRFHNINHVLEIVYKTQSLKCEKALVLRWIARKIFLNT